MGLHPSQIPEADELLTNDPLALLIGVVLDRQFSDPLAQAGAWPPLTRPDRLIERL
ncbi:hypothetical protein FAIPA1_10195 [Frankia sp. AiPs1]|uniref:hypothetical protein n=1 Tax=Frankia sp. AiPa1 TaxID=573492 RepID=UPI002551E850|nr:hypothetical protein [Frankia sp. AiPa1]